MKVITIVGTRPELIKLSRVMARLDRCCKHVIVHTGQNFDYELNGIFFEQLGIRSPDVFLGAVGNTLAETIGNVIARADEVFAREEPDAVLILGDTNSALGVMGAKRRKIPIFHMEAGNRCFDQRVPEEINRRVVDHLSDINLPYTEHARRNLLAEGFPTDRVIKTGSPQKEVLTHYKPLIDASDIHERLGLRPGGYFVASIHREENVDDEARLKKTAACLNGLVAAHDMPLVLSVHPRTRDRLDRFGVELDQRIVPSAPLGLPDYVALQTRACCTISDSGTITEESSILGFPAVTLREAHERPEGMDCGVVIMSSLNTGSLLDAVLTTRAQHEAGVRPSLPADYDVDDVSWKVVKVILSYTDYVNRRVWFK